MKRSGAESPKVVTVRLDTAVDVFTLGAVSGLLWSADGLVLAGLGDIERFEFNRPGGYGEALQWLCELRGQNDVGGPASGPVGFTAMEFNPTRPAELLLPEVLVVQDRSGQRWVNVMVEGDLDTTGIVARAQVLIDEAVKAHIGLPNRPEPSLYELRSVLDPTDWRDQVVARGRDRIRNDHLEKVVLARELLIRTDSPIWSDRVLAKLAVDFPTAHIFAVDGFIGASPEQLVCRVGDMVSAHPLAGTAPRLADPDADRQVAAQLAASEKNRLEHAITIDWLLDTLLPYCSYLDAEPEPSIVSLANVHHLGTKVSGRLSQPSPSALELAEVLHPTPAVGGRPQGLALELIAELEPAERGRYGGPTGWVDADGNGVFAVSVRTAQFVQQDPNVVSLFAGVGVVADSDPQAELLETRAKFRAMLGALLQP